MSLRHSNCRPIFIISIILIITIIAIVSLIVVVAVVGMVVVAVHVALPTSYDDQVPGAVSAASRRDAREGHS